MRPVKSFELNPRAILSTPTHFVGGLLFAFIANLYTCACSSCASHHWNFIMVSQDYEKAKFCTSSKKNKKKNKNYHSIPKND
jgi:hypothetical protein